MGRRLSDRARGIGGRNPRGYGLPSLAVALFLLSVAVHAVVDGMVRETAEARAEAAFNVAKEHLDIFKITGAAPAAADFPHLAGGSRFVTVAYGGGPNPGVRFEFAGNDPRAAALHEQKLRAHVNVPNARALGVLRPDDIRATRPERVLRAGDRVAAPLRMRNIFGANLIRAGGVSVDEGRAATLRGGDSTFIEAVRMRSGRIIAGKLDAVDGLTTGDMTLASSFSAGNLNAGGLAVEGRINALEAVVADVAQSGQFAPLDLMVGVTAPTFGEIFVGGLRASDIRADVFEAERVFGGLPERGRIGSGGGGSR